MKKAQVATTLNWIVAYILIVFVMIIFIFFTLSSRGVKEVDVFNVISDFEKNEIDLENKFILSSDSIFFSESRSMLFSYVDFKSNRMKFYDVLDYYFYSGEEEAFDFIKSKMKNDFDVFYNGCYLACINSMDKINDYRAIRGEKCSLLYQSCDFLNQNIVGYNIKYSEYKKEINGAQLNFKLYVEANNEKKS